MSKYVVRTNCEYSLEVEAASEEDALRQADAIDVQEWAQAWAPHEAELVEEPYWWDNLPAATPHLTEEERCTAFDLGERAGEDAQQKFAAGALLVNCASPYTPRNRARCAKAKRTISGVASWDASETTKGNYHEDLHGGHPGDQGLPRRGGG